MKSTYAAVLAVLVAAAAAKDERTFSVLRFNNLLTRGRMDPIVTPGETSQHVHGVLGGSGFHKGATAEDLMNSECTSATVQGDNSAYWFPTLYFRDPSTEKFEPVPFYYASVYYFFEPTDDEIKAFPVGLQIVAGDANTRVVPSAGAQLNLDPNAGPINNVQWSCPRLNNVFEPPSWPVGSDGSTIGMGSSYAEAGVGFPHLQCDGMYSPLRADVHMPSCYNPNAGLDNWRENMAWPTNAGNGKLNCPEGHIHLPHLFFEVYWDTPAFVGRWTPGNGNQPFVLSNGDVTGFSSHADFFAGWDEGVLQNIIDTCNTGTDGMHTCPGVIPITSQCSKASEVDEVIDGVLDKLPGDNPLKGWGFGTREAATFTNSTTAGTPVRRESSRTSKQDFRRHVHARHLNSFH